MRYWLTIIPILTFNFCLAEIYKVCPSCKINDISKAYELCVKGDSILVLEGTYILDNLNISKSISIYGNKGSLLKSKSGSEILTITAKNVTISGLTFTGVKTNYLHEDAAIRIKSSKGFIIEHNRIEDCFFAIYLENGKNGIVRNNIIDGDASTEAESGNGIHAWSCDNIRIANNKVSHQRDGVYLEFVNNSTVINNHSFNNTRYGLHYMFSNDDSYINNVFEKNGVGVAVMFSRRITMKDNTFSQNWGHASYGLLLKEIYDADILNNKFQENTIGIFVEGSNRVNYTNNIFRRNGWAIKFSGGCEANIVSANDFLHNSIDLVVSSKLNDNSFNGNYWSGYSGYDLDKNGIGDIPHYPVKLYSYILNQSPESIVLLRSLFVDIINYAEKVSPVFTPKDVMDNEPYMTSRL